MTLGQAIFVWLTLLTPHKSDAYEDVDAREQRLWVVARAVRAESEGNFTSAAAMLAIMRHESHLAREVHSGEKLGDNGSSVCLMMIHKRGLRDPERWATLGGVGLGATGRCVGTGLEMWGRFWGCYRRGEPGQRWEAMFSAYGTGAGCGIEDTGRAKAHTFRAALDFLYRNARKP